MCNIIFTKVVGFKAGRRTLAVALMTLILDSQKSCITEHPMAASRGLGMYPKT